MTQDLRYGLRQLTRTPAFTVVAILTFALGIGANSAVFSVVNAVVLRFLPVSNPEQLVFLHTSAMPANASQTGYSDTSFTLTIFEQLRQQKAAFAELIAYVPLSTDRTAVRYGNDPETVWADMVSGNFFSGLGVRMAAGRALAQEDETARAPYAVISDAYFARRFDRNPAVIGGTLFIKGVPFEIVGVTAPGFAGIENNHATDVWIPIQSRPELKPWGRAVESTDTFHNSPNWWFLMMIGRLAPGVNAEAATAIAQPAFQRAAYATSAPPKPGEQEAKLYLTPARGIQGLRTAYQRPLNILMAMVAVVLLIACGNVSMLLAARNSAREREFSLRTALGGGRMRLVRQLATESALLVLAGAGLGWAFSLAATRVLAVWSELDVELTPDRSVLLFTLAISALAALAFGLAPLRSVSRVPVGLVLRATSRTVTADRARIRAGQFVIAAQIALCLVLLVGASLLARSLGNLDNADLGFRSDGLVVFGVTPPSTVRGDVATAQFYDSLVERLRSITPAQDVTLMSNRIGSGWSNNTRARVDGADPNPGGSAPMRWNAVGADYFRTLAIPLRHGRDFTQADHANAAPVVIINETFAQNYFKSVSPIGHRVALNDREHTVIGVAANSRYTGVRESDRPMAYFPYVQVPPVGPMHVELRVAGTSGDIMAQVRRVVQEFGTDLPLLQPMTQQQQFGASFANERLVSRLATCFGLIAALLVATGLYGTLTYRVSRRTSEIGVRMALGAKRSEVVWMFLRESLIVAAAGIVVGLPLAYAGSQLLTTLLFGLAPADPLSFAAALMSIVLVTVASSLIPARRASAVDPMIALREE
jgi:predicted permease